jgi:hypothetical protein
VVLLTATKKERIIFGTALEGDIIKRDVPLVAVEFYDHQVVAPVATEGENRRELIHRGLALLARKPLKRSCGFILFGKSSAQNAGCWRSN